MKRTGIRWLLVEEVARITRAPEKTVHFWIQTGRLPSVKVGRRRLIAEDDVEKLLASEQPEGEQ